MEPSKTKDIAREGVITEEPQEDADFSLPQVSKAHSESTSGNPREHPRHNNNNPLVDENPILVPKPILTGPTYRKRRSSLPNVNNLPIIVKEEDAIEEMEPNKVLKIKQIKNLRDQAEFNTRDSHRKVEYDPLFFNERPRSHERTSQLENVQEEAKNEEEKLVTSVHVERKWKILKDCDEFNFKEKLRNAKELTEFEHAPSREHKKKTFSVGIEEDPIPEEEVKQNSRGRQAHLHSNYLASPKTKLKVDEIDLERKKNEFEQYQTEIEPKEELTQPPKDVINEDASEENPANQAEELLERAKHKLNSEKDFLKKFLKREYSDEMDKIRQSVDREGSNSTRNADELILREVDETEDQEKAAE